MIASAAAFSGTLPQRLMQGQYTTPASVCDMMLSLLLEGSQTRLLDAGCGTGAFLLRAAVMQEGLKNNSLTLTGLDLDEDALALARQVLAEAAPSQGVAWVHANFIGPLPIAEESLDAVISNPPYVRQEHIKQAAAFDKTQGLNWLQAQYAGYLKTFPTQKKLFTHKADLYAWFLLRAQLLLKPGGRLAFITSNSWLHCEFGAALREFLQHHFDMEYLIESSCERWFEDAAVNSVILIARKKKSPDLSPLPSTPRMIRLSKPLANWLPATSEPGYGARLKGQLQALQSDSDVGALDSSDWGVSLRMGADSHGIRKALTLEDIQKWLPLEALGVVRYPIKTGINRFFYLSEASIRTWEIEPEFLVPILKSAREVRGLQIDRDSCRQRLFACALDKEALRQAGKIGALNYIEWGEQQSAAPRQKRSHSVLWPDVPSVRHHKPWHAIRALEPASIVCNRFFDQRFFFALNPHGVIEDQTFYGFLPNEMYQPQITLIAALLNSTLSYWLVELHGRRNLGEGVLQFARRDMAALPILNPAQFSPMQQRKILAAFQPLQNRSILPIDQEVQQTDRQQLDRLILEAVGMDSDLQERVAEQLLQMVAERRALAKSIRK